MLTTVCYEHSRAFGHSDKNASHAALVQSRRAIVSSPGIRWLSALAAWCEARRAVYNWTDDLETAKAEGLRLAKLAGDLNERRPDCSNDVRCCTHGRR